MKASEYNQMTDRFSEYQEIIDDLLAACKVDQEYIKHIHLCSQCRTGNYCEEGMKLWATSGDMRDRAIAKAEGKESGAQ